MALAVVALSFFGVLMLLVGIFMMKAVKYIRGVYQRRSANIVELRKSLAADNSMGPLFNGKRKVAAMVMLGSGGHTAELLTALHEVPRSVFSSLTYVIADTDKSSLIRAQKVEQELKAGCSPQYVTMPRAREVGQSFVTTVFTTLYALLFAVKLMYRSRPDVLLVNGPGSCVPLCWAAVFFNIIGISNTKVIFLESFTRVKHLSLSGKLLYPIVDRFIVQWPQLQEQHALAEYIGILC